MRARDGKWKLELRISTWKIIASSSAKQALKDANLQKFLEYEPRYVRKNVHVTRSIGSGNTRSSVSSFLYDLEKGLSSSAIHPIG